MPSVMSSAKCTATEQSDDEELLRRLRGLNRPTAAVNTPQRPCRIQKSSEPSSADRTSAEKVDDEELLRRLRELRRPAAAVNTQQWPCRVEDPSAPSSADSTSSDENNDELLRQWLEAFDQQTATADGRPRTLPTADSIRAVNSSVSSSLMRRVAAFDRRPTAAANRQSWRC